LPGHNSSYRREILLAQGDRLAALMEAETVLHAELRRQGHRLYLASDVITDHINITRPLSVAQDQIMVGRVWAGHEAVAKGLSPMGRMLRAMMSLMAVGRRMKSPWKAACSPHRQKEYALPIIFWYLAGIMVFRVIGEFQGFLWGPGSFDSLRQSVELHREQHLRTPQERRLMEPT
jgi:hypothetical protein